MNTINNRVDLPRSLDVVTATSGNAHTQLPGSPAVGRRASVIVLRGVIKTAHTGSVGVCGGVGGGSPDERYCVVHERKLPDAEAAARATGPKAAAAAADLAAVLPPTMTVGRRRSPSTRQSSRRVPLF